MEQESKWIRDILRRGSREAANQLIQAHYDEIYRFVYRQTGHKEDAMDLTQSIFIAVLRALPGYRAERGSFRTWLYRIASHKAIDCRRRRTLRLKSRTGPCWNRSRTISPGWSPANRRCSACESTERKHSRRLPPRWTSRRQR